ncbi:syntaxin-8 isoform X2 [Tenrec ecaudatus]|uniref:syntaxin-8 isoform X2 n=1 Tax=Tenrec ecaudatus TaxID=94439 RepID=UPI003F5AD983
MAAPMGAPRSAAPLERAAVGSLRRGSRRRRTAGGGRAPAERREVSLAGRRRQPPRAGSVRGAGTCRMAPDPWFATYDSTCQIAQQIAEKIQQRNQYERNGENTSKLSVTIRTLLQNLKEKIALLKDSLLRAVSTHQITQLEGDRRQNLLDDLVTRERLLLASFKNEGAEPDLIRSSLLTGGAQRPAPSPWLLEESEETRGLGFNEIRQQQQRIIQEQDAGLDALSSILSRQKQMGQEIGDELDEQNDHQDQESRMNTETPKREHVVGQMTPRALLDALLPQTFSRSEARSLGSW